MIIKTTIIITVTLIKMTIVLVPKLTLINGDVTVMDDGDDDNEWPEISDIAPA